MRLFSVVIISMMLMVAVITPFITQNVSATSPKTAPKTAAFETSPITSWYINTPYDYLAHINTTAYNWTLKSNASLLLSQNSATTANLTAYDAIFGTISTVGSYYVNISITYLNSTKVPQLVTYQNYTLSIQNKPFIYSTPSTFYVTGGFYGYNYSINQGNVSYSGTSYLHLNTTSKTLGGNLYGGSYQLSLSVTDKNGTYTQVWEVSDSPNSNVVMTLFFGLTQVNFATEISPVPYSVGVQNNTLLVRGSVMAIFSNVSYTYNITWIASNRYSISANSTKAPPVDLQFQTNTPGTLRTVDIYENGALWGNETVRANTQGVVSVSYDPSTQPLDPVFSLTPLTSAPPPPPPAIVHAPNNVRLFLFVAAAGFGGFMLAAIAAYTLTGSKKGRKRQL